jgi:hypothetical protein
MTDHDLVAMEYGVFPFRNLIKKRVERNSVLKLGPEKYLSMISQVNQRQKDVVVISGVFRGLKFKPDTGIERKGMLCKGLDT